jgi:hypothetical protein
MMTKIELSNAVEELRVKGYLNIPRWKKPRRVKEEIEEIILSHVTKTTKGEKPC